MKLEVKFSESSQSFNPQFSEVHNISDGGFERGYAAGYADGRPKNGVEYTEFNTQGYATTAVIYSATGIPRPYSCANQPQLKNVVFPSGCTETGDFAFYTCGGMTELTLPATVRKISPSCFYACGSLVSIDMPDEVERIEDRAFIVCGKLALTKLPTALEYIGGNAFDRDYSVAIKEIPKGVKTIGTACFNSCTGITELTFKGKPNGIGVNAFSNCNNLLNIYVPWSEGEVANAPWGATNATIHYNHTSN